MKTPDRSRESVDAVLRAIRVITKNHPHLRVGQLLVNIESFNAESGGAPLFYQENDELASLVYRFQEALESRN